MKTGISGRIKLNKKRNKLYTLISGVYTPLVYEEQDVDGLYYYREVFVTDPEKLAKQKSIINRSAKNSDVTEVDVVTTTTPQRGTVTTTTQKKVSNTAYLTYKRNVTSVDSNGKYAGVRVSQWDSIKGSFSFTQSTALNQPYVGGLGGGIAGRSPLFFEQSSGSRLESSSDITLQNDFTIFISFSYEQYKYVRLLGNTSDANVFISFNEDSNENFHFGLGSGLTYTITIPEASKLQRETPYLLTLIRKGTNLTLRLNGTEIGTTTVATNDLVINAIGRAKDTSFFFGGYMNAIMFWDGALDIKLGDIENNMISEYSNILY